jgi:hypothetical protein
MVFEYGCFQFLYLALLVAFRGTGVFMPCKNLHHPHVPAFFEQLGDYDLADGAGREPPGGEQPLVGAYQVMDSLPCLRRAQYKDRRGCTALVCLFIRASAAL